SAARNAIRAMSIGDLIIVALHSNRIGRIGEITGKAIHDDEWAPLVPPGPKLPDGEMGRRIFVRWDLTTGPDDRDLIVQLPPGNTLTSGELRPTAVRVHSQTIHQITEIMNDPTNWVSLLGKFGYERALSDYIASYPNHLEDGLLPHPNAKIRELVFKDRTRLDVLLIDRNEQPVIVECKQYSPSVADIRQLRHYLQRLKEETNQDARGILVHGGARKLTAEVISEARKSPIVEIVGYSLEVEFTPSAIL
ncbi:MAG: endonuclease NucS, partial [candidate division Zixibacteria bacterium]|nr:endonuclease NucS [candidate division Zixibacteria bacterium]